MTEKFSYKGQILTALIPGIGLPIVLLSALYTIRRVSKRFGGMLCFYLIWAAGGRCPFRRRHPALPVRCFGNTVGRAPDCPLVRFALCGLPAVGTVCDLAGKAVVGAVCGKGIA